MLIMALASCENRNIYTITIILIYNYIDLQHIKFLVKLTLLLPKANVLKCNWLKPNGTKLPSQ